MDSPLKTISELANDVVKYLYMTDPTLALTAVKSSTPILDKAGFKYSIMQGVLFKKVSSGNPQFMMDYLLSCTSPFEEKFGVNKLWASLRGVTIKFYQKNREVLKEGMIEVPITKYVIEHAVFNTLFGFQSTDFRKRKWIKDPILVTNHKLNIPSLDGMVDVPYQEIATIGRQIYVGYDSEAIHGVVRAIDYQRTPDNMSCIVLLGETRILEEFQKVLAVMKTEYRKLSKLEEEILSLLAEYVQPEKIPSLCVCGKEDSDKAVERLKTLSYIDDGLKLTSYGINLYTQIKQRKESQL
jgi:hypothetical protein